MTLPKCRNIEYDQELKHIDKQPSVKSHRRHKIGLRTSQRNQRYGNTCEHLPSV